MHGQGRRAYVPFVDKVLLMGKAVSTKFASCVLMVALGWVDNEQDGNLFEACRTIFNILLPSLNRYPCVRSCSISIHFPRFWRDVFGMWGTASTPSPKTWKAWIKCQELKEARGLWGKALDSLEFGVLFLFRLKMKEVLCAFYRVCESMYVSHNVLVCTSCFWIWTPCILGYFKMTFAIICPNQDFPFNMTNHHVSQKSQPECLWLYKPGRQGECEEWSLLYQKEARVRIS